MDAFEKWYPLNTRAIGFLSKQTRWY